MSRDRSLGSGHSSARLDRHLWIFGLAVPRNAALADLSIAVALAATKLGVLGFVDNTHPAAAQLLNDAVM